MHHYIRCWLWKCVVLLVIMITSSGCATSPASLRYVLPEVPHYWPKPPELPRYQFVGQLNGESNFVNEQAGVSSQFKSMSTWLANIIFGESPPVTLLRPQSGAVDEALNRIYVTDIAQRGVLVFDKQAGKLRLWRAASKNESLKTPIGIAIGGQGGVFIADADLGVIVHLSQDGKPIKQFGKQELIRPTGIARDPSSGLLYVSDTQQHDIKVYNVAGELQDVIGKKGRETSQFNGPTYLAFFDEKLFVTDTLNSRVQIFSAKGDFIRAFGKRGRYVGNLPRPKGVAVDSGGRVYVVESYYDYLLVYDEYGKQLLPIGGSGSGIGQFSLPTGVWTDSDNNVYVADMLNSRVMIFQYLADAANL